MIKVYNRLKKIYWFMITQFGIDLKKTFCAFLSFPRFVRDLLKFSYSYRGRLELLPCLHDWTEEGGATKNEYFWQDLLVARNIFEDNPVKHVDIGSRVDGFVGHVASFRKIEVFDVRPITTKIEGITFKQADFMNPLKDMEGYCDSLSCLHALEHFGLGRYGDPINPNGFELGFKNMTYLLKENGIFYLSVPVGTERVEFNANRIFSLNTLIELGEQNSLRLSKLILISNGATIETFCLEKAKLLDLTSQRYMLAIFIFVKLKR